MRLGTALLLVLLAAGASRAQTPGSCALGTAEGDLDANDVFARVFNTGSLFFGNTTTAGNGYLVPKGTGNSPVFASGLWIGGQVDGEIRVAGARYTRFEYWPGPLNEGATLPDPTDCSAYDRIFVVSRDDIARYLETGEATDDLRDWPVHLGAPVLDGDGTAGNYDLAGGDQPAVYGDQTAWWVMNDVGNVHEETGSNPLGVEVQVTAFAASRGPVPIRQATYYRYRILNRSPSAIDSMYVSVFSDPDLGDAVDDWSGSDTTRSLGFVYNGDNYDGWPGSSHGYGLPPALGYKIVQGPVGLPNERDDDHDGEADEAGERVGMTAFTFFCGGCTQPGTLDPRTKEEYYNHMQGRWKDGTPITEGGLGYQTSGPETTYMWSGDPVTDQCWSMANDCFGGSLPPNDQRFIVHTGPFRLAPGEETEIVFALPFAQGRDHLDSVTQLRLAAESVQAAWDTGFLAPTRVEAAPAPPEVPDAIELETPRPNPFTDRLSFRYTLPAAMTARITLLDVLGREVALLASGEQPSGPHEVALDTAGLPAGLYLVRFEAGAEARTFRVVRVR